MRPRHPAVLLGALIAKHVLEVHPVNYAAVTAHIEHVASLEAQDAEDQAQEAS